MALGIDPTKGVGQFAVCNAAGRCARQRRYRRGSTRCHAAAGPIVQTADGRPVCADAGEQAPRPRARRGVRRLWRANPEMSGGLHSWRRASRRNGVPFALFSPRSTSSSFRPESKLRTDPPRGFRRTMSAHNVWAPLQPASGETPLPAEVFISMTTMRSDNCQLMSDNSISLTN